MIFLPDLFLVVPGNFLCPLLHWFPFPVLDRVKIFCCTEIFIFFCKVLRTVTIPFSRSSSLLVRMPRLVLEALTISWTSFRTFSCFPFSWFLCIIGSVNSRGKPKTKKQWGFNKTNNKKKTHHKKEKEKKETKARRKHKENQKPRRPQKEENTRNKRKHKNLVGLC